VSRIAAREQGLPTVRGDALRLPFAPGSVDVAICTLTLHHFPDEEAVRLLREMKRVARDRVLVSDLERSRLNHLGARVLAHTLWRTNRLTRHDGPLSVLRSFTAPELLELGRRAGLRRPVVRRYMPWRLVLEGGA
jgi:ubiquinone/menaquinone biosynthesis C-methylase UbiE